MSLAHFEERASCFFVGHRGVTTRNLECSILCLHVLCTCPLGIRPVPRGEMGMRSLPSQTLYKSGTQPAQTQTNCESEITMEVYLFRTTTSNLHCSSFLSYRTQRPSFLCQSHRPRHVTVPSLSTWRWKVGPSLLQREVDHHRLEGVVVKCEKLGSGYVAELERELQEEINPEEKAEWMRLGRLRENCGGRKGVVELLECLEREAIMGEDQGREPNDYNRRAQIFDKSSRVFQALKERTNVDVDVDGDSSHQES